MNTLKYGWLIYEKYSRISALLKAKSNSDYNKFQSIFSKRKCSLVHVFLKPEIAEH